jgi:hypothetical protein
MRALVSGWFSFDKMGASAGDLLVRDVVCEWLDHASFSYDVALAKSFSGGVDWQAAEAADYSHIIFVCGPFGNGWPIPEFLSKFAGSKLVGVNLSMVETLDTWNPFDLLLERDSSACSRPDLAFLSKQQAVPVVGVVTITPQREYRERGRHQLANDAIHRLVASQEMSAVSIDTRLDINGTGLRTPAEVESLIARMDVIFTTRLHGLVLALKNGVPVIAIDPIANGAKIRRQGEAIGWPLVFTTERLNDAELSTAFAYCQTADARSQARECGNRARHQLLEVRAQFQDAFAAVEKGR